jgi:hypothetical protein
MKALALSLALVLLPGVAAAHSHRFDGCGFHSRYDMQLTAKALLFTLKDPSRRIEMDHGALRVDGKEVVLSPGDRERIAAFEANVRTLVPQIKAIGRDAAEIAYTAVSEVASALAGEHSAVRAKLDRMRSDVRARIDASFESQPFNEKEFEALVESSVKEMVPALVGDLVSVAVQAALSGDEKVAADIERRADRLGDEIERRVETQARQIEARAEALCPQLAQLDRLETNLELRLGDGSRLDLLDVRE